MILRRPSAAACCPKSARRVRVGGKRRVNVARHRDGCVSSVKSNAPKARSRTITTMRHLWLLPAAAALLAGCIAARMCILSLLLTWASGVQLTVSQLTLEVTRAASITIVAHEMLAYSPGARADGLSRDSHLLANVSRATVRLRRPEPCAAETLSPTTPRVMASWLACMLDFRGDVSVEGVHLHFISYDALLADTNVKRLVLALGADEAAATGALPTGRTMC